MTDSENQNGATGGQEDTNPPVVFVSYSHDNDEHKKWVLEFSEKLVKYGIDTILDQWDLDFGADTTKFMEDSIKCADKVLMICTECYVQKMNDREGGVGYEAVLATGNLIENLGTTKFIPVVRQDNSNSKLPTCMGSRKFVNFNDTKNYEEEFKKLAGQLHKTPANVKPKLGSNPFIAKSSKKIRATEATKPELGKNPFASEPAKEAKPVPEPPPTVVPEPITPPPLQLPQRPDHFIGRDAEVEKLIKDLQPGKIAALCGSGGIGKSALASEVLWQLTRGERPPELFPDGVIWHNFYREPKVDTALAHIATSLGMESKPTPHDGAMRALSGRRVLLLLDGTEDADNLPAILEIIGNCGAIVTSRKAGDARGSKQDIAPLNPDHAVKLLRSWGKGFADDDTTAEEICRLIGRLPLAVRLVGRYLSNRKQQAEKYLEWLKETPIEALDPGDSKQESVSILLERSLDQVKKKAPKAQQAMAIIGLIALFPFSEKVIAKSLGMSDRKATNLLGELISWGLLIPVKDRFEVSHALIHTYAREELKPTPTNSKQLLQYYKSMIIKNSNQTREGSETLDPERLHIMKVMENQFNNENWQAVIDMVWGLDEYYDMCGYWIERQSALEMGLPAANNANNFLTKAEFLNRLGLMYIDLGKAEKAIGYPEQGLAIYQKLKDRQGEGIQLGNLGLAYSNLGQVEKAIEYHEQALVISREIKDRRGEGIRLGNLGIAYSNLGMVDKAIEYHEQALAISREIKNSSLEGYILSDFGVALRDSGNLEKAMEQYEQALAISQEIKDPELEGNQLGNLGVAYCDQGKLDMAIENLEQALAISQKIKHRRNEGIHMGDLGNALRKQGSLEKAMEHLEQALKISREVKYPLGEGKHLGNMGRVYSDMGQSEKAGELYVQSIEILDRIKSPKAEKFRKLLH